MEIATITNEGTRDYNEDYLSFLENKNGSIFVLADGLGGHGRGEEASKLAVETIIGEFKKASVSQKKAKKIDGKFLGNVFEKAQKNILKKQIELKAKSQMKTTLCAVLIKDNIIRFGHIGDSRIYFFKNNKVIKRTYDHSVPQMLVSAGTIKEKKIRNHPDRNRLLRVMGSEWENDKYEIGEDIPLSEVDAFLLCCDGFWELITEKVMQKILKKTSNVNEALEQMSSVITKNGKGKNMDNWSGLLVIKDISE